MEIEDIRLFTEVVSYTSISEAARRNHMTQQTLSRRIISLERETGLALLERTTPIAPTAAGKLFLRYAYELLTVADEMRGQLDALAKMPKLFVRVRRYETDSFFHVLARLSETMGRTHPNIEFEFVYDNRTDCDLVRDGRLDVGFAREIYGASELPKRRPFERLDDQIGFVELKSNSFPLVFGVPEDHPILLRRACWNTMPVPGTAACAFSTNDLQRIRWHRSTNTTSPLSPAMTITGCMRRGFIPNQTGIRRFPVFLRNSSRQMRTRLVKHYADQCAEIHTDYVWRHLILAVFINKTWFHAALPVFAITILLFYIHSLV